MYNYSINNRESERKADETTAEYLERVRKMGFLFHGSDNKDIEELEPRYTFDPNSEKNTDTAVFATNNIAWTIIFGLYGGYKGWATSVRNGMVIARIPKKDKELVENTTGAVYVLPFNTFEKSGLGNQYKSKKPVKPISKVDVTLSDYYELGGRIEWF